MNLVRVPRGYVRAGPRQRTGLNIKISRNCFLEPNWIRSDIIWVDMLSPHTLANEHTTYVLTYIYTTADL